MRSRAFRIGLGLMVGVLALVSGCSDDVSGPDKDVVVTESFYYRFEVSEQVLLAVSGINGEVVITGVAESDSIVVKGIKRVESWSTEDALEHLDSLTVEVKNEAGVVSAVTDQPDESDGRTYEVDYEIIIPPDLAVDAQAVNATVSVASIERPLAAGIVNGVLELDGVVASVAASVVNGQIEGDLTLPAAGVVSMSVVNGTVDIDIPANTSAMFSAGVVNGSITVTGLTLTDRVTTPTSVTGKLGDGNGTIDLSAVNGTVTARGF